MDTPFLSSLSLGVIDPSAALDVNTATTYRPFMLPQLSSLYCGVSCPASFYISVYLHYHSALSGGSGSYKAVRLEWWDMRQRGGASTHLQPWRSDWCQCLVVTHNTYLVIPALGRGVHPDECLWLLRFITVISWCPAPKSMFMAIFAIFNQELPAFTSFKILVEVQNIKDPLNTI